MRQPLTQFIENQLRPLDLVAIMYPLTPVTDIDFTRNHAKIINAIQHFEGRKYKYEPRNLFEEQYQRAPTEVGMSCTSFLLLMSITRSPETPAAT